MRPIELCEYTLRQSMCDEGKYPEFYTAQEILEVVENE
jgi:hypothetical protein